MLSGFTDDAVLDAAVSAFIFVLLGLLHLVLFVLFSSCSFFFLYRMQKMQLCIWGASGWEVDKSEPIGPHVNHLPLKVHRKVSYICMYVASIDCDYLNYI